MTYRLAKKLHNEDEVTLKTDKEVCRVIEVKDDPNFTDWLGDKYPLVWLIIDHPNVGLIEVTHYDVK